MLSVCEPICQPFVLLNHVTDFKEIRHKKIWPSQQFTSSDFSTTYATKDNMADVQNRQMEVDQISFVQPALKNPKQSPLIGYGIQDTYKFHISLGQNQQSNLVPFIKYVENRKQMKSDSG